MMARTCWSMNPPGRRRRSSPRAARILAEEGPPLLYEILEQRAHIRFDQDEQGLPLFTQEVAHSRRRISQSVMLPARSHHERLMTALQIASLT